MPTCRRRGSRSAPTSPAGCTRSTVRENQAVHAAMCCFASTMRRFASPSTRPRAQLAAARLQVESLKANYRQRQAELAAAAGHARLPAARVRAPADAARLGHRLAVAGRSRRSMRCDEARAQVAGAQQQIGAVVASLGGNPNIAPDRHPAVQQAQAALDRARLDLSYRRCSAPSDGIVTRVEQLQVGSYIDAAAPVFALVSDRRHLDRGQFQGRPARPHARRPAATVEVDSYPGKTFRRRRWRA